MTPDYLDLLSPNPIYVNGIGSIRKVKLVDLLSDGIHAGLAYYFSYLYIISATKKTVKEILKTVGECSDALIDKITSGAEVFEALMLSPSTARALYEALSFFICEHIEYDSESKSFIVYQKLDGEIIHIGTIDKSNYNEVRDLILETNCLTYDAKDDVEAVSDNDKLLKMWEEAERMNNELQQKTDGNDTAFGNVVSKLCALNVGVNFENVWNLTVYQALDQLQQLGYLRSVELAERSFSIYGGDHFNINEWLHSIQSKRKDDT